MGQDKCSNKTFDIVPRANSSPPRQPSDRDGVGQTVWLAPLIALVIETR